MIKFIMELLGINNHTGKHQDKHWIMGITLYDRFRQK
jgi:hypothetical protein